MFLGLALYVIYQPTWLHARTGASGGQIALLFLAGGIANALTGPLAGKLSDRVGRKSVIIASCLGLSVMMPVTPMLVRGAGTLWIAYPLFFVTMILVAARMSPFQALLSALATGEERGSLLSLTVALGQVGFALGGVLAGLAYSRLGYTSNTIGGATCMLSMAFLVWRFVPEPESNPAARAEDAAAAPQVRAAVKATS
jgi:predicted MFS family arabinose efflux permease